MEDGTIARDPVGANRSALKGRKLVCRKGWAVGSRLSFPGDPDLREGTVLLALHVAVQAAPQTTIATPVSRATASQAAIPRASRLVPR